MVRRGLKGIHPGVVLVILLVCLVATKCARVARIEKMTVVEALERLRPGEEKIAWLDFKKGQPTQWYTPDGNFVVRAWRTEWQQAETVLAIECEPEPPMATDCWDIYPTRFRLTARITGRYALKLLRVERGDDDYKYLEEGRIAGKLRNLKPGRTTRLNFTLEPGMYTKWIKPPSKGRWSWRCPDCAFNEDPKKSFTYDCFLTNEEKMLSGRVCADETTKAFRIHNVGNAIHRLQLDWTRAESQ